MDCCNYVEAYAGGGHFYQQQHYFCYENATTDYGGYEPPPISAAIETTARYNGTIPPAYPTDYVYNPKEARLRKAMREQTRELSRRSILQNAIARAGVIAGPVASGSFLDHQHRFGCVSTSGLPMSSSVEADRIAEPWFQAPPRPKPIHSPRMTDWYSNVGDPIERLQVMGMHQRGLDKCKEAIRNQASVAIATECGPGFSSGGYPVDFSDVNRERELRRQENIAEYTEFTDSQKWHPYQNGGGAHQHPRMTHPSQMAGILHSNIQNRSSHGHGPWGQFCHGVLPHTPPMPRNVGVRGPRHTVLLRDRLPTRHCEFPGEARMAYNTNKLDIDNVRASYSPPEHQMPRLLESSVDSVIDSATTSRIRREDEGPRWEPNAVNNRMSMDNLAVTTESNASREKERESRRSTERFEAKKKAVSKQPLPGFHQAFGSTEIGRFSRSEFFVNMVGESGGNVEVADTESTNVSTERMSEVNGTTASAATHDTSVVTTSATTTVRSFDGDDSEENNYDESNELTIGIFCEQPTAPRWHSPHVGALLPKTYLPSPVIFPFSSRSCGILGASAAIHRITENGEILSRIMPEECCWFAGQSRCGVSRISDNIVNCTAFLDCSHHARDKEWFCQNTTMTHPSEVLRQIENYESFTNERGDGSYVIIGTPSNENQSSDTNGDDDFDEEIHKQTTLKMENDGSPPKHSSVSSGKKDGNI
ncbi:hypothetical protein ANTQUA_LOCUS9129 [Anthophora quadrimaculata]